MKRFWFNALIATLLIVMLVPLGACDDDSETTDIDTVNPIETSTVNEEVVTTEASEDEESVSEELSEETNDVSTLRIVSLAPSNTEILFALGLGGNLVGVTEYCDFPPEAQEITFIGGFNTIDMEKIIELHPDLILAANIHKDTDVPELKRRGFNVITLAPETLNDIIEGVTLIGEATGAEEKALVLTEELWDRVKAITDKTAVLAEEEKPHVLYITWHDPIWTLGKGTITHELIELAGGINVVADLDGHGKTDLETIIARNPQIILASTGHGSAEDSPVTWAQTEDRLEHVDARINDRIYQVDSDLVTRPGPRIVDGLEIFAEIIHPQLFGE